MAGPLHGVRVVEVASFITGPYAGQLLCDLGAEVIKVEDRKAGDPFRLWGGGTYSPHFISYNRGKKSLTLDLKKAQGKEVLLRLLKDADVLIENFRPGVADRLGIGYDAVQALNPRIVYCSISGMGQTGPYAQRPSYDMVGQGLSGLLSLLLNPNDPRPIGPAFSDGLTGVFATYGIQAALFAREHTGRGQRVETSMLEATMAFLLDSFANYFVDGEAPGPFSRPKLAQAYAFTCADGQSLAIHLSSPAKFWEGLCRAVERDDLLSDPELANRDGRVHNYERIRAELAPVFLKRPRADWLRILEQADVPFAPVQTLDQVLADPQIKHLGMERVVEHPTEGPVRMIGFPVRLTETALDDPAAPPTLGEHTVAILAELGYSRDDIQRLRDEEAI